MSPSGTCGNGRYTCGGVDLASPSTLTSPTTPTIVRQRARHLRPAPLDPAADRVSARPSSTRQRLVDHDHRLAFGGVVGVDRPAAKDSNSHRVEITRRGRRQRGRVICCRVRRSRPAFDREHVIPRRSINRQRRGRCGRLERRVTVRALREEVVDKRHPACVRPLTGPKREPQRQHMIRTKPGLDRPRSC